MIAALGLLSLISLVPLLVIWYFRYWETVFSYWSKRGFPYVPGRIPHGSSKDLHTAERFLGDVIQEFYCKFTSKPFFGIFRGRKPTLVIRDPEIVKLVLAKDFSHFRDRRIVNSADDDILSKHLFLLDGDKWRALRVKMTPTFTSGKLKGMFPLFVKCAESLETLLLEKAESEVTIKDLTSRFSMDVIVSCAFGLESDTINNDDSPFRKVAGQGDEYRKPTIISQLRNQLMGYFPFLSKQGKIRITPPSLEEFMVRTVRDTVEQREQTGQRRNDFIDLLMQLREKGDLLGVENGLDPSAESLEMTMDVMVAQCYVFFVAGFETSSSVKTFCLYELALNPDIQERLHEEIVEVLGRHSGEVTYQAVQEMEYLDMVAKEGMRKYPTLQHLDRACSKEYTFPTGESLERGVRIIIPVWSLHHDPKFYPKPELFDPQRHTKEAREKRHPYVFLPFGEGPRICIGNRFGLLQVKMGLITILRKFRVERSEKTEVPLEFMGTSNVLTRPKRPIILKLTKRQ